MKRLLLILAAAVVVIAAGIGAIVAIQLLRSDDPDLLTSAPQIPTPVATVITATVTSVAGVTPSPAATTTSPVANPTAAAAPTAGVLHFSIDAGSSAKYVVREKLAALPVSSDAVGTTSDITGDLFLTPAGLATGQTSSFKVDLRTL